ncbi:Type IV secretory pathway, VirD4 component, TraG/TraD family ATPase [Butyrivibrio sp. ob235]|uniref:type IV secretory system conjugative DNA transfer family protein n=1 Tax=Butyrivibrio sp. ob235 TaxID=1761780 RepID=UPI0008B0EE2E|nr:type IV secretory system conjugative DNA transfer family protein [Butyrivibrio sp. ob235]SEK65164.1 Type IV secretory pathway, VirD4 component, TraG/TraD family ATPase [Butyrivibrio sp. ob235]
MTIKSKLIASGIWVYPVSLIAMYIILDLLFWGRSITPAGHLLAWGMALIPSLIICGQNIVKYCFQNKRDFNFIDYEIEKAHPMTPEKLACMYPSVKDKFLAKSPDGFILGKKGNSYVRIPLVDDETRFGAIVGEPGSGKSANLIIPSLLANFYDVGDNLAAFVVDIKPELAYKSVDMHNRRSIRIVNPTDRTTWGWDVYYDIDENSSDDEVVKTLTALSHALIVSNNNSDIFFVNKARDAFCGMMLFYFREGYGFIDSVKKLLACNPSEEIPYIISVTGKDKRVYQYLKQFEGDETNAMKDAISTMREHLTVFLFSEVQYALRDNPLKCDPQDLNKGKSIFLSLPENLLDEYKDLFRLILAQTLKAMESRPDDSEPVLFIFDEFGRIGKVDRIKHSLATLRSRKCHIYMAFQNISQIREIYGNEGADGILGMCRVKVFTGTTDINTIRSIKELAGSFQQKKRTYKSSNEIFSRDGDSISFETVNVLDTEDVLSLEEKDEIIAFIDGKYYRFKKNPYYMDPVLKEINEEVISENNLYKEM